MFHWFMTKKSVLREKIWHESFMKKFIGGEKNEKKYHRGVSEVRWTPKISFWCASGDELISSLTTTRIFSMGKMRNFILVYWCAKKGKVINENNQCFFLEKKSSNNKSFLFYKSIKIWWRNDKINLDFIRILKKNIL